MLYILVLLTDLYCFPSIFDLVITKSLLLSLDWAESLGLVTDLIVY